MKDGISSLRWMVAVMLGSMAAIIAAGAIVAAALILPWVIGKAGVKELREGEIKELRERVVKLEALLEGKGRVEF